jgi:3',5'-cyclic AMP phosphodiesterase CpdA
MGPGEGSTLLTIAQISDLHITNDRDPVSKRRNALRLRQVLTSIHALQPRPAAIVISGDLVDRGEPEEYRELQTLLRDVEIPIYCGLGNHDRRAAFLAAFAGADARTDENGFVQFAVDFGPLRLVVCDTLDEGREGGAFCELRAAWLAKTLADAPDQPTVVAIHHPPILSGIQWMDPEPDEPWIQRFAETIRPHSQVQSVVCGHVHRAFSGVLAGHAIHVAPASSIQLTLNLTPIDMRHPDGREILVEEPAGYMLLMAHRGAISTHVCVAGDYPPPVANTVPFDRS